MAQLLQDLEDRAAIAAYVEQLLQDLETAEGTAGGLGCGAGGQGSVAAVTELYDLPRKCYVTNPVIARLLKNWWRCKQGGECTGQQQCEPGSYV